MAKALQNEAWPPKTKPIYSRYAAFHFQAADLQASSVRLYIRILHYYTLTHKVRFLVCLYYIQIIYTSYPYFPNRWPPFVNLTSIIQGQLSRRGVLRRTVRNGGRSHQFWSSGARSFWQSHWNFQGSQPSSAQENWQEEVWAACGHVRSAGAFGCQRSMPKEACWFLQEAFVSVILYVSFVHRLIFTAGSIIYRDPKSQDVPRSQSILFGWGWQCWHRQGKGTQDLEPGGAGEGHCGP